MSIGFFFLGVVDVGTLTGNFLFLFFGAMMLLLFLYSSFTSLSTSSLVSLSNKPLGRGLA